MGFTNVTVQVYNPTDLTRAKEVELLVDSGALFTAIPGALLEELGLRPVTRRKLRVFGGSIVERNIGVGVIEYKEACSGAPIVFGEEGDIAVLGITALEALGYQLDPVTKELKPVELLMI
ncbi:hypothetical protein M1N59_00145 [Dehalococcoidales bacterium]|nr:hypothetical protein [Dehalococcoidales bacterium]